MADAPALERFVEAQARVYAEVRGELAAGRKQSHWMWFVFPQLKGLGTSAMATHYGLSGAVEARAFIDHPLLGPRLLECTSLMLAVHGKTAFEILGSPDDLKFCSSMSLFEHVAPEHASFADALARYCGGRRDERTLARLGIARKLAR